MKKLPTQIKYRKFLFTIKYTTSYQLSKLGYGKINGFFNPNKREILIATDGANMAQVLVHELFHFCVYISKTYPSVARKRKEPDEYIITKIEKIFFAVLKKAKIF
jgi:hypothetical protein